MPDPETGTEPLVRQTPQQIVDRILAMEEGTRFQVLAGGQGRKGTYDTLLSDLAGQGFARAIVDGQPVELADGIELELERYETHDVRGRRRSARAARRHRAAIDRFHRDGVGAGRGRGRVTQIVPKDDAEPRRSSSASTCPPVRRRSFEGYAPRNFSFNSPYGACGHCDGLGTVFEVDPQLVVPDGRRTADGDRSPWAGVRSLLRVWWRRWREYGMRVGPAVGARSPPSSRICSSTGRGAKGRIQGPLQEPVRPHPARIRRSTRGSSVPDLYGTPRPRAVPPARRSRATMRLVPRVRSAAGPG
ncbi:MAG: hypothetical protein R2695_20225 [Acidimicrobiales bacterium]